MVGQIYDAEKTSGLMAAGTVVFTYLASGFDFYCYCFFF